MRALGEEESYKYLGMLEADHVLHEESKERLKKEYIRRVKKCLKSKLNGGNMLKAINTWAVSLMRYSAGIVEWTKADLDVTERKTRKFMTMYGMLHPTVVSRIKKYALCWSDLASVAKCIRDVMMAFSADL